MVQFDEYGVYEVEIATGTPLWFLHWPNIGNNERWANVADPLVFGDRLFISTGYAVGCVLLDISSDNPRVIWSNRNLCADISTPIFLDGYLFGCHDERPYYGQSIGGTLRCLDFGNGELVWEEDLGSAVTISAAANRLLLLTEHGMLSVAEASPKGYRRIASYDLLQGKAKPHKFWTPPVLCNGLIYCRNYTGELFCLNVGK
jgi:outer membrane protein assembly factor BamB